MSSFVDTMKQREQCSRRAMARLGAGGDVSCSVFSAQLHKYR
ncbi:MAG: hypothetical protein RID53_29485 [Coleofasciculus sp. B1-GNL1-01]